MNRFNFISTMILLVTGAAVYLGQPGNIEAVFGEHARQAGVFLGLIVLAGNLIEKALPSWFQSNTMSTVVARAEAKEAVAEGAVRDPGAE